MNVRYLKIKISDVKRYIKYYEKFYNMELDKDGYKYVIENLMYDLDLDIYADNKYYIDILSSLHNFVKGGKFNRIEE